MIMNLNRRCKLRKKCILEMYKEECKICIFPDPPGSGSFALSVGLF